MASRAPARAAALWRAVHTLPAQAGARRTFSGWPSGARVVSAAAFAVRRGWAPVPASSPTRTQSVRSAPQGQRPVTAAFVAGARPCRRAEGGGERPSGASPGARGPPRGSPGRGVRGGR